MNTRTRFFLFAAAGVLIASLATGLAAWWATRVSAAGGATDELAYVPATALMVAYADVRGLMNSPFHERIRQLQRTSPAAGSDDLEARTGIRFDTDIDGVLVASTGVDALQERADASLLIARGRFDASRIEGVMRSRGGQVDQYRGKRIVTLTNTTSDTALAFAEPSLLLFGPPASVRGALDAKAGAAAVIASNREFMALVNDVSDGTAWSVAKLDSASGRAPFPPALMNQLPPINWFAASGRVDSGLHGRLRAEARDVESAESLRDVIQGFLALAKLQGGRDPAYRSMLDSVALTANGTSVSLSFDVTPAALDLLTPSGPGPRGPATPQRP